MSQTIAGIVIPDSALAKATTEYIRDVESDLLYNHSRRVFLFGALSGQRKQLAYDPELLYVGAMFHDLGLVEGHRSDNERFEVDSANNAKAFMKPFGLSDDDVEQVWLSIALHTTPGVPQHLRPNVALVTAGVEMDVLGIDYAAFPTEQREAVVHAHPRGEAVVHAHPRGEGFKECILCAFANGFKHRPDTTFGTVNADVLVDIDPSFKPLNFVEIIRTSPWVS
ncbi:HD domain-containing protein [Pseudomonas helleri]|uniref:HD domain-containing protein n=1 Tax=Pseudomonas helleri TaxID=1608996 RepID=UPI002F357C33